MTTHNTHSEHNDVDTSVVRHPSAPDSVADSSTPSTEASSASSEGSTIPSTNEGLETAQAEVQQSTPSSDEADSQHTAEETTQETHIHPVASTTETSDQSESKVQEDDTANPEVLPTNEVETPLALLTAESTNSSPATTTEEVPAGQTPTTADELPTSTSESSPESAQPATPVAQESAPEVVTPELLAHAEEAASTETPEKAAEDAPLITNKAEEIRPFTDFIEEFRQAEAARLQATLQDTAVEAFTLLTPTGTDESSVELEVAASSVEENILNIQASETVQTDDTQDVAAPSQAEEAVLKATTENQQADNAQEQAPLEMPRPAPVERAVSPLLRPASRLRIPRHGVRHIREDAIAETAQTSQPEQPTIPTPTETAAQETPRPARRYRFDRPSKTTLHTPASPVAPTPAPSVVAPTPQRERTEEVRQVRNENIANPPVAAASTTSTTPPVEVVSPVNRKQANTTEQAEAHPTPAPTETGRKRHSHKEQSAAPAPQTAPTPEPVVEPVKAEEIAPEDLPPLEYSELQKASTRRRRRHRTSTSSAAAALVGNAANHARPAAPAASTTPAIPTPPLIAPLLAAPAPVPTPPMVPQQVPNGSSAYTIVSGYTVNQMNQGNDMTGPFMGPEPSPARGSVFTRDGRTSVRAEAQRSTSTTGSHYAARSNENGLSTASMTQFANIVSQSIQTQTDRMVAELRRANQSPTNVSVTLPPFPSTERVGVFVDVANLLYSARTLRMTVDFGKLLDFLRGNRRLIRAHAYCPTSPQAGDEQMFLQAVKGLGYRITTKNYKTFSSGAKKADLDLDLCMDVVRLVDGGAVDCIVLVSGDSDFMPMLDYCSDHGVRVEVAAFDEAMSATLRQSCDLFVNLSLLEEIRG
ncbi:NYN domain-containing protein [Tengunoibacter tsumagoiensis]|uniref:NYN domain-containing protein n=1 Tax=Tengunoibacter tsumagoiensis TaxID=2014871 RepID=A0A401ZWC3_9CHLR|nr:NYN domain-containing protein [Tengunoibacter tsumagoiensis]GCE11102.1 hypothetical protein KTT_09610 [Tengunoibacter tsumagoiensis]